MKRQGLQVASPTNSVESSTPYQTGMAIAVQRFLCDLEREKEIQAKKVEFFYALIFLFVLCEFVCFLSLCSSSLCVVIYKKVFSGGWLISSI